ncbi:MAG: hypothetical protein ACI8Z1_001710 [Candidatus Azotimanducaceae bacterium]
MHLHFHRRACVRVGIIKLINISDVSQLLDPE